MQHFTFIIWKLDLINASNLVTPRVFEKCIISSKTKRSFKKCSVIFQLLEMMQQNTCEVIIINTKRSDISYSSKSYPIQVYCSSRIERNGSTKSFYSTQRRNSSECKLIIPINHDTNDKKNWNLKKWKEQDITFCVA